MKQSLRKITRRILLAVSPSYKSLSLLKKEQQKLRQSNRKLQRRLDELLKGQAALDEAMMDAEARAAKTEALLQAFKASGKSVEVFADMYGMDPRAVSRMLARATVTPSTSPTQA